MEESQKISLSELICCAKESKKLKTTFFIFSLMASKLQQTLFYSFNWHIVLPSNIINLQHICFDDQPFKAEDYHDESNSLKLYFGIYGSKETIEFFTKMRDCLLFCRIVQLFSLFLDASRPFCNLNFSSLEGFNYNFLNSG